MKLGDFKTISIYVFIFIILVITFIFIYYFYKLPLPETAENLGQFGDYIGGTLNPLLAFLSFSALLITIFVQLKQLDFSSEQLKRTLDDLNLSRTELALTRTELKRSADAQTGSKAVMEEQLLTQSLQQFDSTFFAMLRELNNLQLDLNNPVSQDYSKLKSCLKDVMSKDSDNMQIYIEKVLNDREVSRYFMLLYQILRIIDTKINDNIYLKTDKYLTKKMYSNIVRASVSEELMQLLIINALNSSFTTFKKLLESFCFFEHTSFQTFGKYNLVLINASIKYDDSAFGQSFYKEELKKSNLFGKYVIKNKIMYYKDLYFKIFSTLNLHDTLDFYVKYHKDDTFNSTLICQLMHHEKDGKIGIQLSPSDYKPSSRGYFSSDIFYRSSIDSVIKTEFESNQIVISSSKTLYILITILFDDLGCIDYKVYEAF